MCPEDDADYVWHSTSSNTTLTIIGDWSLVKPVDGVKIRSGSQNETLIDVTMNDGEPVYFELKASDDSGLEGNNRWRSDVRTKKVLDGIQLIFDNPVYSRTDIKVMSMDGKIIFDSLFPGESLECFIPNSSFVKGVNIVRIVRDGKIKVLKLIF